VLAATSWGVGSVPGHPLALAAATGRAVLRAVPTFAGDDVDGTDGDHGGRDGANLGLGLAWQLAAIASWSCFPWLRRIGAPTLVVTGAEDLVVPVINARLLAALVPRSELVVLPAAGHDLFHGDALRALMPPLTSFLDVDMSTPVADQASA
jgi:pimeloyl-ACP methyl ester carboxylesterase